MGDAAYAIHQDMKVNTGGFISIGTYPHKIFLYKGFFNKGKHRTDTLSDRTNDSGLLYQSIIGGII